MEMCLLDIIWHDFSSSYDPKIWGFEEIQPWNEPKKPDSLDSEKLNDSSKNQTKMK